METVCERTPPLRLSTLQAATIRRSESAMNDAPVFAPESRCLTREFRKENSASARTIPSVSPSIDIFQLFEPLNSSAVLASIPVANQIQKNPFRVIFRIVQFVSFNSSRRMGRRLVRWRSTDSRTNFFVRSGESHCRKRRGLRQASVRGTVLLLVAVHPD